VLGRIFGGRKGEEAGGWGQFPRVLLVTIVSYGGADGLYVAAVRHVGIS